MTQLQEYELIRNFMTDTSKTLNSINKVPNYQHDFNLLFKVYNKIWDTEEKRQNKNDIYFTLDFNTTNACTLSFSTEDGTYLEFIGEEDTAVHSFYSVLVQYLKMHKKRKINIDLELYEFSKKYYKYNAITLKNHSTTYKDWNNMMSVINAIRIWALLRGVTMNLTLDNSSIIIEIEYKGAFISPLDTKYIMFMSDKIVNIHDSMYECLTQFITWYSSLPKNVK